MQGTNDLQIDVSNALTLAQAGAHATHAWIEGMNHVLKTAPGDRGANFATYANPNLPLAEGLLDRVVGFIHQFDR